MREDGALVAIRCYDGNAVAPLETHRWVTIAPFSRCRRRSGGAWILCGVAYGRLAAGSNAASGRLRVGGHHGTPCNPPRRSPPSCSPSPCFSQLPPLLAPGTPGPIVVGYGPLAGVVIALDPGHNGGNAAHAAEIAKPVWIGNGYKPCNQVGTSTLSGYPEHAFNFDVALRVKASLERFGRRVYLTRTNDTGFGPCVDVRGKFGEKVGADLTVSIHGDGASASNRGFFVMKPGPRRRLHRRHPGRVGGPGDRDARRPRPTPA